MAETCSVFGCGVAKRCMVSLHALPKDPTLREKWVQFIWKNREPPAKLPDKTRVCSSHFQEDCFENLTQKQMGFATKLILKPEAAPSIYPGDKATPSQHEQSAVASWSNTRDVGCQCEPVKRGLTTVATQLSEYTLKHRRSVAIQVKPTVKMSGATTDVQADSGGFTFTPIRVSPPPSKRRCREEISEDTDDSEELFKDPHNSLYQPSTSNRSDSTVVSDVAPVKDSTKYIVYENCLLSLFHDCPNCGRTCEIQKFVRGTFLSISQRCPFCDFARKWNNQPIIDSTPAGNLHPSAAMTFTRSSIGKSDKVSSALKGWSTAESAYYQHATFHMDPCATLGELPQQYVCKEEEEEEVVTDQQLCNQGRNSSLDQEDSEPPQIKAEQEELCATTQGETLVVKLETDTFMLTPTYEANYHTERETKSDHRLLYDNSYVTESQDQKQDFKQEHVCKEEEEEDLVTDQQLCNQERNSSLDQEDPEPPQIKEEQEELCTSQEGETFVVKVETDTFMLSPAHEESDDSELETQSDHELPSDNSHVDDSQDQSECEHGDSEPTGDAAIDNVYKPNRSEIQCNTQSGTKSVKCDTCGKAFKFQSKLNRHLRVHTGEKPYSCDICGRTFSHKSNLNNHTRTHTGERPYTCKTCGKSFTESGGLSVHVRIHTGEKPYLCQTCRKGFIDMSSLKKHMRIHTGEKPYSCHTCGRDFRFGSGLRVHMRMHRTENELSC